MNRLTTLALGVGIGVALVTGVAMCVPPKDDPAPTAPAPTVTVEPVHTRPADDQRATGPVDDYDTGVLFCGANAGVATDVDEHGNAWAYCEPGMNR